jgi:hypothetical protein
VEDENYIENAIRYLKGRDFLKSSSVLYLEPDEMIVLKCFLNKMQICVLHLSCRQYVTVQPNLFKWLAFLRI